MGYPRIAPLYGDLLGDIRTELSTALGVDVWATIPNPRPATFITLMLAGGGETSEIVETSRVLVDCWADSDPAAHRLSQRARQVVCTMIGRRPDGSGISKIDITALPSFTPDDESEQPRFRFTANITRTPKEIE